MDQHGLQHHAARRRIKKGWPLIDTKLARVIDLLVYPLGLISILLAVPQAYQVWIHGHVEGLSLVTWSYWCLISIFWVFYGMVHRVKAMVFMSTCWVFMYAFIALGIYLHS